MKRGKVHVIGAGLSGLSAAVKLAQAGVEVELSEAAAQAGGRCRSYLDPQLGLVIDNGNHLVLSGNAAVTTYLERIGAGDRLAGPDRAEFAFADVKSGEQWRLRPNEGPLPWWVLSPSRRVPGTRAGDYLELAGLMRAKPGQRVDEVLRCQGALWERLMRPFLVSALNTEAEPASAALAGAIVAGTLAKGGRAYRPRTADPTLAATFVDPALASLERAGARVRLGRRLKRVTSEASHVIALAFADGDQAVAADNTVVLAVPPWVAQDLVPGLSAPTEFRAIVNGHFKLAPPAGLPTLIGVIGGVVEWIFAFEDRISVTVSAADRWVDMDREALALLLWRDVAAVHGLAGGPPPWQIVKEKRATFAATPEQDALRPPPQTCWDNLLLAGDWVQTGLPATIEGAVRSGEHAANLALARLSL